MRLIFVLAAIFWGCTALCAQDDFVHWENPHVHPIEMTPDESHLVAVNLPDARIEVFDISAAGLDLAATIPVGLDPVTVRARNNDELWVVNHVSDSVSIVDLPSLRVIATIQTDDEPCDVVFTGVPERAYVSCSQVNRIQVFDPNDLSVDALAIDIAGEDPRALAKSSDGAKVYVAIFESGNATTILGKSIVSTPDGPYQGANPPPNAGAAFSPAQTPGNPSPPEVAHVVRKDASGAWLDDNGGDWTEFVSGDRAEESGRVPGWGLVDRDVAIIDTLTGEVTYVTGLMTSCMGLAVHPVSGNLSIIGTEARNEIRFEPNIRSVFLRVLLASADPDDVETPQIFDLNPHLDYLTPSIPAAERARSLGDPRAIVWNSAGDTAYVAGMGSNNVVAIDAQGTRVFLAANGTVQVGEGPTGLVLDEVRQRLYVLNKFESSVSIIDLATEMEELRLSFFDPTPDSVRAGRKHNYGTHATSGLGHVACASCHIDSRTDRLAWDLGDPAGEVKEFDQNCIGLGIDPPFSLCSDWHPMKGPMVTQTLQDIIGKEPFHWRGDRAGIEEFDVAFTGLLGADQSISDTEMAEYKHFLASISFPPNYYRHFDNTLPDEITLVRHFEPGVFLEAGTPLLSGNPIAGMAKFEEDECTGCHFFPSGLGVDAAFDLTGAASIPIPTGENDEHHHMLFLGPLKVMSLRGLYDRVGFDLTQAESYAGFGFRHDGTVDSLPREVSMGTGAIDSAQALADVTAFLLAFTGSDLEAASQATAIVTDSRDTHAAVGKQVTFDGVNNADAKLLGIAAAMKALADEDAVGLIAKGVVSGEARGFYYSGRDQFQSDRSSEETTWDELLGGAAAGAEITLTVVPKGSEARMGVDRDLDGALDRDEMDRCSNPAGPGYIADAGCQHAFIRGDCSRDNVLNLTDAVRALDYLFLEGDLVACRDACDVNDSGSLNLADPIHLLTYLFMAGAAPSPPHPNCGDDPSADELGCSSTPTCE